MPQHHADVDALLEDRDAEAAVFAEGEAEVGTADLGHFLLAAVGGDAFHQRDGVVRLEYFGFQAAQAAVQTEHGGLTDGNVQVGSVLLHDGHQQFIDEQAAHRFTDASLVAMRVLWAQDVPVCALASINTPT